MSTMSTMLNWEITHDKKDRIVFIAQCYCLHDEGSYFEHRIRCTKKGMFRIISDIELCTQHHHRMLYINLYDAMAYCQDLESEYT